MRKGKGTSLDRQITRFVFQYGSSTKGINFNPILDGVFGHPISDGGGGQKAPHLNFE